MWFAIWAKGVWRDLDWVPQGTVGLEGVIPLCGKIIYLL